MLSIILHVSSGVNFVERSSVIIIRSSAKKERANNVTKEEQNIFLNKEYTEVVRYMDNAKEALQKARKRDDGYYVDKKYVRTACGVAYSGVLIALDAWFKMKGVTNPKKNGRKSVDFYKMNISMLDKKMADRFDTVYDALHLFGYYDGRKDIVIIRRGFDAAYEIIDKIKPENPIEIKESSASEAKRVLTKLLISLMVMFR